MIKKLLIMMLVFGVVFVAGCGKKDETTTQDTATNQEQTQTQDTQDENAEKSENEQPAYTPESARDVTSVDIKDMSQEDLDTLVEMFNNPDSTPEQKEASRIQLEEIFKQAEQSIPQ